jgi:hypothetical protein
MQAVELHNHWSETFQFMQPAVCSHGDCRIRAHNNAPSLRTGGFLRIPGLGSRPAGPIIRLRNPADNHREEIVIG